MPKILDLSGRQFGRLTAIRRVGSNGMHSIWLCICQCGTEKQALSKHLTSGGVTSCGCRLREGNRVHGHTPKGTPPPPEYNSWQAAKDRCFNPANVRYARYGGRGISMCKEWVDSYATFIRDMGPKPPGTSIERMENDFGYCPANCTWANAKEQANNRRKRKARAKVSIAA